MSRRFCYSCRLFKPYADTQCEHCAQCEGCQYKANEVLCPCSAKQRKLDEVNRQLAEYDSQPVQRDRELQPGDFGYVPPNEVLAKLHRQLCKDKQYGNGMV